MERHAVPDIRDVRLVLPAAVLLALASQVSIQIVTAAFNVSAAIILLPVFLFLMPDLPAFAAGAAAAPLVYLLRGLVQWAGTGSLDGCWTANGPELLFYLVCGLLFQLWGRKIPFHPLETGALLPLTAIDALSNLAELTVRLGGGAFRPEKLLQILLVALVRSGTAWLLLWALDRYGVQVLRREDAERYQRLLLMTAALKSEVAWMDRGTGLIEDTMNAAYQLYSQLRASGADRAQTDTALAIAKDIHEVKKEYLLLMRGISEAMERDAAVPGMELSELFGVLERSVERTARAAGKDVVLTVRLEDDCYTTRHPYLMSIFRNLLDNAVEAAGTGRRFHLTVTGRREGDRFRFQVADDCGGIPASRVGQVFRPGFSSKIDPTTGTVNRGLGLAIVKELTEDKLHGTIQVEVREGGTVFHLDIPARGLEGV